MRVLPLLVALVAAAVPAAQIVPSNVDPLHRPFDRLLDTYVRDGFVYYNALRLERGALDGYIASLNTPEAAALAKGTPEEQKAFWINAYNALVLRTVIDHYPIRGRTKEYPATSIRQIPGAFDQPRHRVAGRTVSLDQIEKEILAPFGDARVFFALGRGAQGGGRLRSEAFDGATLERLLAAVEAEASVRNEVVRVDRVAGVLSATPVFSWREPVFVETYATRADEVFSQRSPLERAVVAMILPHVPTPEAIFLRENTFKMQFHDFDWRLNDLGAR